MFCKKICATTRFRLRLVLKLVDRLVHGPPWSVVRGPNSGLEIGLEIGPRPDPLVSHNVVVEVKFKKRQK